METNGNTCLNCSAPLPPDAVFCPQCGQKDKDTRVSFIKIVREALATLLNLDSALLRTLPGLLVPGKLTMEFFRGRQKRYMNPVRLFLWVTVILIALITLRTNNGDQMKINGDLFNNIKETWHLKKALSPLDSAMADTRAYFPEQRLGPVFDSIRSLYLQRLPTQKDSLDLHQNLTFGIEDDSLLISMDDLYTLTPHKILDKYQVNGFWNRLITQQKIKFFASDTSFGPYLIGKLTWAILILMPLLALIMKLLYIRRDFFYVEHIIFAIHTHTMAFVAFSIALLAEPWLDIESFFGYLLLGVGAYVLLSQKRYYRQGWLKTFLKFGILQIFYAILIVFVLLITLVAGFFLL
jgi:hypothetical protein